MDSKSIDGLRVQLATMRDELVKARGLHQKMVEAMRSLHDRLPDNFVKVAKQNVSAQFAAVVVMGDAIALSSAIEAWPMIEKTLTSRISNLENRISRSV